MMRCPKCGKENNQGDQYCAYCGAKLFSNDPFHALGDLSLATDETEVERSGVRPSLEPEQNVHADAHCFAAMGDLDDGMQIFDDEPKYVKETVVYGDRVEKGGFTSLGDSNNRATDSMWVDPIREDTVGGSSGADGIAPAGVNTRQHYATSKSTQSSNKSGAGIIIAIAIIVFLAIVALIVFKKYFGSDESNDPSNNGGYSEDGYTSDNGSSDGSNNDYHDDNNNTENSGNGNEGNDTSTTEPSTPKLEKITIDPYALKNTSINPYNKDDKTISPAEFTYYSGTISQTNQADTYYFSVTEAGVYRIELSDMVSGFKVSMCLYDSSGSMVKWNTGIGQGYGVTASLDANSIYKLVIEYSSGTGAYNVFIGRQKPTIDITNYTTIYDSIEFVEQQNNYLFTPAVSGVYRFYIAQINSGIKVSLNIYDDAGYGVDYNSGIGQGDGATVTLEAGRTYLIRIQQSSNTGDYALAIGYQKKTTNISKYDIISDSIQFSGQENQYIFSPTSNGEYTFEISGVASGTKISIYVYDSAGYRVNGSSGMSNGSKLKVSLEANGVYSIVIKQSSGEGDYTINVSK